MVTFKILPLSEIKSGKTYRLVLAPNSSWARSRNLVIATKKLEHCLITALKGYTNEVYSFSDYGKKWGLQSV